MVFGSYFLAMMNGLLPVGIVVYRLMRVCYPKKVETANQRRKLNYIILALTLGLSLSLTTSALYYKEYYHMYRLCMGEINGGPTWDLPIWHPHRIVTTAAFLSRTIVVPSGYIVIYFFRRKTDRNAPGLTESSRKRRITRNAVNAKFNFYIWLSEMSSFIVLIFRNTFSKQLFIVLSFGVSPILYLLGMEETRIHLQKLF